jgi:predicted HTH transcriptional regulator
MKIPNIIELKTKLLKSRITEHNYENVELKRDWSRDYGEKISMLCNGHVNCENYLMVGVEDNGPLSGHKETWLKKTLEIISQQINEFLDPVMTLVDITTEDISGNKVIILTIKNPGVVVKWNKNAWGGCGTTKRKLDSSEILELSLKLPGLHDISKFKTEYAPDINLVKKFCDLGKLEFDDKCLDRYHLNDNRCGKILFGNTKFRVVKYDSNDDVIVNETRKGLLNILTEEFSDEIRHHYNTSFFDSTRISNALLKEALGNTVGHAAYHENDGEISIELYSNKIHVSNLAYNEYLSLANKWFSSAHKSPNPFLMETLRVINKVDELGRGKKKLLAECLMSGFNSPFITITDAGRHKRWSLIIDFGLGSQRLKRVYSTIQEQYGKKSEKSLIAYALVLWRDKPFSEIAKSFDTHESKVAAEIISDFKGPVYYWKQGDQITLYRWVKVLLEEGKASKSFTAYEEKQLFDWMQELQNKYYGGLISPKEFRELAHLSDSQSDRSLTSKTLKRWDKEGKIKRVERGVYKFTGRTTVEIDKSEWSAIMKVFERTQDLGLIKYS